MTSRLTVLYGRDADAYLVARDADRALEGSGYLVSVEQVEDRYGVWIVGRDAPVTTAVRFLPGQQLVVTHDDGWRIEDADADADAPERAS